jgi:hypothetical protein
MRRALVVAILAAVTATPARAAPGANALIRPGVGIGPLRLGMTPQQVRHALGQPIYVRGTRLGFGRLLIEYSYWLDGYTAYLLRVGGKARVVSVQTTLAKEKTASGLGVGSTERQIRRVYPDVRCSEIFPPGGGMIRETDCVTGPRAGRQLVFAFSREPEYPPGGGHEGPVNTPRHVDWVVVRTPF